MKKAVRRAAIVVLLAAGITAAAAPAARQWLLARFDGGDADAPLVLYGNVDIREVELAFRQPGRLVTMAFEEGDRVRAGAVMAELDPEPYRDAVAVAKAEVRRARAELEKLRRGNRPQEIAQAEAAVRQAEATFRNAERDYKRKNTLLPSNAVSQTAVDTARTARDESAAALASRRHALALLKAGARREDIAAGEAKLAAAKASLAQAQTALADTRLVSPADAVVLSRVREPGSMVSRSTPVYTLSLRDPVYVRAYVSEPDLGRLAPGTKVRVRTDSSDKVYVGQIGFISPRAEFTPRSVETTDLRTDLVYRLRIVVTNADDGLRQGMPVTVLVDAAPRAP